MDHGCDQNGPTPRFAPQCHARRSSGEGLQNGSSSQSPTVPDHTSRWEVAGKRGHCPGRGHSWYYGSHCRPRLPTNPDALSNRESETDCLPAIRRAKEQASLCTANSGGCHPRDGFDHCYPSTSLPNLPAILKAEPHGRSLRPVFSILGNTVRVAVLPAVETPASRPVRAGHRGAH